MTPAGMVNTQGMDAAELLHPGISHWPFFLEKSGFMLALKAAF